MDETQKEFQALPSQASSIPSLRSSMMYGVLRSAVRSSTPRTHCGISYTDDSW